MQKGAQRLAESRLFATGVAGNLTRSSFKYRYLVLKHDISQRSSSYETVESGWNWILKNTEIPTRSVTRKTQIRYSLRCFFAEHKTSNFLIISPNGYCHRHVNLII